MSVIQLFFVGCWLAAPLVLLVAGAIAVFTEPGFIWAVFQIQADNSPLKLLYEWQSAMTQGIADE